MLAKLIETAKERLVKLTEEGIISEDEKIKESLASINILPARIMEKCPDFSAESYARKSAFDKIMAEVKTTIDGLNEFARINGFNIHIDESIKNVSMESPTVDFSDKQGSIHFTDIPWKKFCNLNISSSDYGISIESHETHIFEQHERTQEFEICSMCYIEFHTNNPCESMDLLHLEKTMTELKPSYLSPVKITWSCKDKMPILILVKIPKSSVWKLIYRTKMDCSQEVAKFEEQVWEAAFDPNLSIMENVRRTFVPMINGTS